MSGRTFFLLLVFSFGAVLCPVVGRSQVQMGGGGSISQPLGELSRRGEQIWHVSGRVSSLRAEPLSGVKVRVEYGKGAAAAETLQTNLRGEFQTDLSLEAAAVKTLRVTVVASKPGYLDARETLDFGAAGGTWEIGLVLREKTEGPDQLSLESLIADVVPRLSDPAAPGPALASLRKDYVQGVQDLLERRNAIATVSLLAKVVEGEPNCVNCRTLVGLAHLDAGSWDSATREFAEGVKLTSSSAAGPRSPVPYLMLGILESWRGQPDKAGGFFLKALEIEPNNPWALQELGRALVFQRNWEAADQYLEKAIRAGASKDAHLLRARALLEEDDAEEADAEMKAYLEGRVVSELPLAVRTLMLQVSDRVALKTYRKVKSVVAQRPEELVEAMPELRGLEPAPDQEKLPVILRRVGEDVAAFFRHFPNTVSVEQVLQERLNQDGKVRDSVNQEFQYLLLAPAENEGLGLDEYRTDARGSRTGPQGGKEGYMLTAGFACASLLFHPGYQAGASFRHLGRHVIDGRETLVLAFAQQPETARIMERFKAGKVSALILLQGVAWVDSHSYRIVRLRTDLLKPPREVRLAKQTTEIQFDEVQFKELPSKLWLPREVAVTVEWRGKIFRNRHTYSDFKLFRVETEEKRRAAQATSGTSRQPN